MNLRTTRRKALVFAASLGSAAVLAELARPRRTDAARAGVPLESIFPPAFGHWRLDQATQAFVRPADEQGKVYGIYDQVLERAYLNARGERVMLSAAYGSEQSAALQVHQPEVCYVASGFRIEGKKSERMALAQHNVPVTRLHARLQGRSEPITYWVVLGDTATADSSAFRWLQLSNAFSGRVRDGMLVRVSNLDPDPQASYELHARFAAELLQAMPSQYRDRVFGTG